MEQLKRGAIAHLRLFLYTLAAAPLLHFLYRKCGGRRRESKLQAQRSSSLLIISGCDSGLGLSMSLWASGLGYNVLCGLLHPEGPGATILKERSNIFVFPLDLTDEESTRNFRKEAECLIERKGYRMTFGLERRFFCNFCESPDFSALISNAALLVCGEFFWQTKSQWRKQMDVNFWGSVNLTKEFQPLLFKHKSRLIIISSDCSKLSLPALSIYAASKSALESWARALRLEIGKYGVTVVCYQPANFREMEEQLSPIDREFYGTYFQEYKNEKGNISEKLPAIKALESKRHERDLKRLLEDDLHLTPVVVYETWAQLVLLWGEKYLPRRVSDKLLTLALDSKARWVNKSYEELLFKSKCCTLKENVGGDSDA